MTNTALVDTGDFLNVWVVDPDEGSMVSGEVLIRAAPETSVTVNQIEFYVNGNIIGTDADSSDGWTVGWDTTVLANGDYALAAVARSGGLTATSSPVTVTVVNGPIPNQPPTASFTYTTAELMVNFTDHSNDPDGNVVAWAWNFGDGNASNLQNPIHTYASGGTYTVSLTVTDNEGATASTSEDVSVTSAPPPNQPPIASFIYTTSELMVNFTDQSNDPDGSVVAWSWNFGDGNASNLQNPIHTYASGGTYTVSLTVTDNEGATGMAETTVTVTSGISFTGSSTVGLRGTWNATVSVTGGPVNTTISGTWNIGGTPNSCMTDASGACSFTRTGIRNNIQSVTWTYTATGQTVTIFRP